MRRLPACIGAQVSLHSYVLLLCAGDLTEVTPFGHLAAIERPSGSNPNDVDITSSSKKSTVF